MNSIHRALWFCNDHRKEVRQHGEEHWQGASDRGCAQPRQVQHPNGTYVKRDTTTGRILNVSDNPHKGVRDEK